MPVAVCAVRSGSAFASNAVVAINDFVVVQGEDVLKTYIASSGLQRLFCSHCGVTDHQPP
jgi:hypothetical protein